jgi:hypothetical protein
MERAKRVTVFGLDSGSDGRQECPIGAVAAVFGNPQPAVANALLGVEPRLF